MIRLFWGRFFAPDKNPRLRLRPLLPTWNPPPTRRPEAKELVPRPIFFAAPKRVVSAFMPWISWRLLGFWCENVMKYHEIIPAPRHCQTIKNSVDMSRSSMLNLVLVEEWDSWKVMLVYLSFSAEQQQLQPLLLIACSELLNMNSLTILTGIPSNIKFQCKSPFICQGLLYCSFILTFLHTHLQYWSQSTACRILFLVDAWSIPDPAGYRRWFAHAILLWNIQGQTSCTI